MRSLKTQIISLTAQLLVLVAHASPTSSDDHCNEVVEFIAIKDHLRRQNFDDALKTSAETCACLNNLPDVAWICWVDHGQALLKRDRLVQAKISFERAQGVARDALRNPELSAKLRNDLRENLSYTARQIRSLDSKPLKLSVKSLEPSSVRSFELNAQPLAPEPNVSFSVSKESVSSEWSTSTRYSLYGTGILASVAAGYLVYREIDLMNRIDQGCAQPQGAFICREPYQQLIPQLNENRLILAGSLLVSTVTLSAALIHDLTRDGAPQKLQVREESASLSLSIDGFIVKGTF